MTIVLVRHGWAGDSERWHADDRRRPLDERGHVQALELPELLAPYPAERILASPYLRCVQTMEPLATLRGLVVEPAEELAQEVQEEQGLAFVRALLGTHAIVCTHGGSPWDELAGGRYEKGAAVVLDADGSPRLTLPPPA
jgi:8-oxo-dGTP diphosphatase